MFILCGKCKIIKLKLKKYCCNRHLWFYDRGRSGRVEIVPLWVGARAKEGNGGGKKKYSFSSFLLSPCPLLAPFDSPHFLLSPRVSTSKKNSRTRRKRPRCRLFNCHPIHLCISIQNLWKNKRQIPNWILRLRTRKSRNLTQNKRFTSVK